MGMKMILPVPLLISFASCSTPPRVADNETSAIPPGPQSRLPAGTVNTVRNTGNPPVALNPRNLSDQ